MTPAPQHRSLIVGTAGHIDHGKTALIKLLTGVDTDRLKQEKERGISIELGFTSLELPSGERLGVVDVPGHERFIKNMLAGAGGIDLILFVIAADEGVMPQTREHMDIIDLLGVEHGVVALTKIDMVEPDFVDIVEETVREYLADSCLKDAPIVRVSARTGEGRADVLAALAREATPLTPGERGRLPRLPIDRTFIMEGFGTVVTGTLWSGKLTEGETVHVLPSGLATRIKSLEVHNERVKEALAGQRVAVALHAIEKTAIRRGDWLLGGMKLSAARLVDAKLRVLRTAAKPLANSARVRFHLGSAEILGRLILLDSDELKPGQQGWAQLRLEDKVLTERGDRFVLRTYSPMHTIAGGLVVTAGVGKRRRYRKEDLEALAAAEVGTPEERVLAVLARTGSLGADRAQLARESGCTVEETDGALTALIASGAARAIGRRLLVAPDGFTRAAERLTGILSGYQRGNELSWGIQKSELKKRVEGAIAADLVDAWVQEESESGRLFPRGDRLRHGSDQFDLSPEYAALKDGMLSVIREEGFAGRSRKEVAEDLKAAASFGRLGPGAAAKLRASTNEAYEKDIDALLLLLLDAGEIVRVPPHFYFAASLVTTAVERVRAFFKEHDEMRVADLKSMLDVSRKQAVPLLEYLDQARVTQRDGDARRPGPKLRESGDGG